MGTDERNRTGMNKVVIARRDQNVCYGYFCDGKPTELYIDNLSQESFLGNIYAARVEKVAEGLGAMFLELSDGKKAYMSMKKNRHVVCVNNDSGRRKGGDILLVQITKEGVKTKLPVAEGNLSFSGKYMVLTFGDRRAGISRKITSDSERVRLKLILDECLSLVRQEDEFGQYLGAIFRTNAQGVSEDTLREEWEVLLSRVRYVLSRGRNALAHTMIYREPRYYETFARELPENELDEIVTDDAVIFEELKSLYGAQNDAVLSGKLKLYEDSFPLYQLYRMQHFYEEALKKTVYLKSGGSIVIEPTEALTVIDVNSGSVLKGKRQAQNIFRNMNLEASEEIARQIRLRNLSGIIVIDFINLSDEQQRGQVLEHLRECCRNDRVPCRVVGMTALQLCEMTRSKLRKPLHEEMKRADFR